MRLIGLMDALSVEVRVTRPQDYFAAHAAVSTFC